MKLLVFSDIHGNLYAFQAFLREIRKQSFDKIIFCGDIFGYYYDQKVITQKLCQMKDLIWLKGNHDEYFCRLYCGKIKEQELIKRYGHSYENVKTRYSIAEYNMICEKTSKYEMICDNDRIGIFHGTPKDILEGRLYPKDEITDDRFLQYDIVILGHTHFRMIRNYQNTVIINPGSLGQPRDGNGYSYCMIDTANRTVDFKNVVVDTKELYEQIDKYDSGLTKLKEVLERRKEDIV